MPQILVRGLQEKTVERLKAQARSHRRSLQQEVRVVLEQAAAMLTMEETRDVAEARHRRLAGRSFSDSAELIREDRDSR